MISLVERGHLDRVSLRTVRRILAALDASVGVAVRWRAGSLDRLLDEDHALLVDRVAGLLRAGGWSVETEVTYAHYGERGSYDILAYHSGQRVLLVVELKSDLASAEQTLRKLDEKVRLAPVVARTRFDGPANGVARLLAMPDDRTLRRHVARHTALFDVALPDRKRRGASMDTRTGRQTRRGVVRATYEWPWHRSAPRRPEAGACAATTGPQRPDCCLTGI
jgi:hypothetical protein